MTGFDFPQDPAFNPAVYEGEDPESIVTNWGPFGHEGWAVFNGGPDTRIERLDELAAWPDDPSVWTFIASRVMARSARHIAVFRDVRAEAPEEWQTITDHLGASLTRLVIERLDT